VLRCRSGARHESVRGGANHGADCGAAECAAALVGARNAGRWVVASQDAGLRDRLRAVPGVPDRKSVV